MIALALAVMLAAVPVAAQGGGDDAALEEVDVALQAFAEALASADDPLSPGPKKQALLAAHQKAETLIEALGRNPEGNAAALAREFELFRAIKNHDQSLAFFQADDPSSAEASNAAFTVSQWLARTEAEPRLPLVAKRRAEFAAAMTRLAGRLGDLRRAAESAPASAGNAPPVAEASASPRPGTAPPADAGGRFFDGSAARGGDVKGAGLGDPRPVPAPGKPRGRPPEPSATTREAPSPADLSLDPEAEGVRLARQNANAPQVMTPAAAATVMAAYKAGHAVLPEFAERAGLRRVARIVVDESMSALSATSLEAARLELGDGIANRLEQRIQAALRETNSATREQLLSAAFYDLRRGLRRRLPDAGRIEGEVESSQREFLAVLARVNQHLTVRRAGASALAEAALQLQSGSASEEQIRAWRVRTPAAGRAALERLLSEGGRRDPARRERAVAEARAEALSFEETYALFDEVGGALASGPPVPAQREAWLARVSDPGDRAALESLLAAALAHAGRTDELGAQLARWRAEHRHAAAFLDELGRVDQLRGAALRAGAAGEGVPVRIELEDGTAVEGVSSPLVFERRGGPFAVPPAFERYLAGLSSGVEMEDRYEVAGVQLQTGDSGEFYSADGRFMIATTKTDGRIQRIFSIPGTTPDGRPSWIPVGTILEDAAGKTPPLSVTRVEGRETLTEVRSLAAGGARSLAANFGANERRLSDDERLSRIATVSDELATELDLGAGLTESLTHMLRHRVREADRFGYPVSVSAIRGPDGRCTVTITEDRGAGRRVYELQSPLPSPPGRRPGNHWSGGVFDQLEGQPPIPGRSIRYENAYAGDPSRRGYDPRNNHGPLVREGRIRIEEEGSKIWEMHGTNAYEIGADGAPTRRRDLSRDERGDVIGDTSWVAAGLTQTGSDIADSRPVQAAVTLMEAAGRGAIGVAYVLGGAAAGAVTQDAGVTRRAAADAMLMFADSRLARGVYGESIVSDTYRGFNSQTRELMNLRGAATGDSGYLAWRRTASPQERLLALSENQSYGQGTRTGLMLLAVGVTIGQGLVESAPLMVAGPATNQLMRGAARGLRMARLGRAGAVVRAGAGRVGSAVGGATWAYDQYDDMQTTASLPLLAGRMWTSGSTRDIHDFLVAASDSHLSDAVRIARETANPARFEQRRATERAAETAKEREVAQIAVRTPVAAAAGPVPGAPRRTTLDRLRAMLPGAARESKVETAPADAAGRSSAEAFAAEAELAENKAIVVESFLRATIQGNRDAASRLGHLLAIPSDRLGEVKVRFESRPGELGGDTAAHYDPGNNTIVFAMALREVPTQRLVETLGHERQHYYDDVAAARAATPNSVQSEARAHAAQTMLRDFTAQRMRDYGFDPNRGIDGREVSGTNPTAISYLATLDAAYDAYQRSGRDGIVGYVERVYGEQVQDLDELKREYPRELRQIANFERKLAAGPLNARDRRALDLLLTEMLGAAPRAPDPRTDLARLAAERQALLDVIAIEGRSELAASRPVAAQAEGVRSAPRATVLDPDAASAADRKTIAEGKILMIQRLMEVTIAEDPQAAAELSHLLDIPGRKGVPLKLRFESRPGEIVAGAAAAYLPGSNEVVFSLDHLMSPTLQMADVMSHERQHAYDNFLAGNTVTLPTLQTEARAFEAMGIMQAALRRRAVKYGVAPGSHVGGESQSAAESKLAEYLGELERLALEGGRPAVQDYLQTHPTYASNLDAAKAAEDLEALADSLDRYADGKATAEDRALIAASPQKFMLEIPPSAGLSSAVRGLAANKRFLAAALWVEGRTELAVKPDNPLARFLPDAILNAFKPSPPPPAPAPLPILPQDLARDVEAARARLGL